MSSWKHFSPGRALLTGVLLFTLPIISCGFTVWFDLSLLASTFLFFALPAVVLGLLSPRDVLRQCVLWSFLFSIPLSVCVDTLGTINGAWFIPVSAFPIRILGIAPVENWLYGWLWGLFACLFYESFFGSEPRVVGLPVQFRYLLGLFGTMLSYVFIGLAVFPQILHIPYYYATVSALLIIIPLSTFMACHRSFVTRFMFCGVYFAFVLLLFEVAALVTGQWTFPGNEYVGYVQIGRVRFPLEEFVAWTLLATPAYLAYYEYFGKGPVRPRDT